MFAAPPVAVRRLAINGYDMIASPTHDGAMTITR
jgi:hypothetical protein